VAIYVSEAYNSAALTVTGDTRTLELLWVLVEAPPQPILVGALYHPPKYSYPVEEMYEFIETSLDELLCQHPDASVVLAGDFNKLNVTEISVRKGLLPLVKTPTRSGKILDMLMISPPQKYQVKVIRFAVRTDHSALLATTEAGVRDRTKTSYRKSFRRCSPEQHANLLLHLRNFDSGDKEVIESEQAWREFYDITLGWLEQFYPLCTVTVTSRDPPFITP